MEGDTFIRYGADAYHYNDALPYPGLQMARVLAQYKELYKTAAAAGEILAEISGKFRYEVKNISGYPVTGDSEPGCAVQGAIASGELDERRFENYQKLKKEALYDGLSSMKNKYQS